MYEVSLAGRRASHPMKQITEVEENSFMSSSNISVQKHAIERR